MTSATIRAALAVALFVGSLAFVIASFETTGDVTYFLPSDSDREDLNMARSLARSDLGKTMILVITGEHIGKVVSATRELGKRLAKSGDIAWVRSGLDNDLSKAFYDLFFPTRFGFLSEQPETELPKLLSDPGLAQVAVKLKLALSGPLGPVARRTAGADPFLAFQTHLLSAQDAEGTAVIVEDGVFRAGDRSGIIFLSTRASPFDSKAQRKAIQGIRARFDDIKRDIGDGLSLEMSGLNRLAVKAEQSTRRDITRISILSLLGTTLLFLFFFRSLRYLAVLFVPVAFGLVGGLAACLALFGEVHGLTLAFGATLIGVSVDYSVHFMQHHFLSASPGGAHGSLRKVWGGIVVGGMTTIVGFVGMAWTSTPGMRQIAVFGGVGVAFALIATGAVLPAMVPHTINPPKVLTWAHSFLSKQFSALKHKALYLLPLVALALCIASIRQAAWNDDPQALVTLDADLMDEDARIQALVSTADPGRFAVAAGTDWESALKVNDELFASLQRARQTGELKGFASLHSIVWSQDLQQRNLHKLWDDPDLAPRLVRALAGEGFREGAFAEFATFVSGDMPAPLLPSALLDSALADLLRGFYLHNDDGVLLLTRLQGVSSRAALQARIEAIPGARYFDQQQYLRSAYSSFRTHVFQVVVASLVIVLMVVLFRYRRLRTALAAFLPAVLAASTTLALLSIVGAELNLLHVLGLMLVLSIGVDYGVFVVEAKRGKSDVGIALLGTAISCMTTILSFGLLALSENPALSALGASVAIGAALSFLFAPVGLVLSGVKS